MWYVTQGGVNILKKISAPCSYSLGNTVFWRLGGKGIVTQLKKKLINDKGVRRTAPATRSLLISVILVEQRPLIITYKELYLSRGCSKLLPPCQGPAIIHSKDLAIALTSCHHFSFFPKEVVCMEIAPTLDLNCLHFWHKQCSFPKSDREMEEVMAPMTEEKG